LDSSPGLVFVQAGQVGGKLHRQHGEVVDSGVDGLGLGLRGQIERRALGDGGSDIGDADQDTRSAVGGGLGVFDLVEVAGGVVVDRRPEKLGKVFQVCGRGRQGYADGGELGLGAGRFADVEAVADHLGFGGSGKVEGGSVVVRRVGHSIGRVAWLLWVRG
jgi:hypothetical protein